LEANKGFEYLLHALALAAPGLGERWGWLLVGDGSDRAALQALAGRLGLGERVFFAGQVEDAELHNLYALANLFAHPTLYEGSSLVTLEAMAHGLPVVASAVGGIPDKVVDGRTGYLVPPADPRALAARITQIASDLDSAREMGARGAELAEERFSWRQIAKSTEELFLALLDEKAACQPLRFRTESLRTAD
jgi:glycosyltransferase involved in cell wall biosynthesis